MRESVTVDTGSAVDALNVRHTIIIISILYSRRHAHPPIDIGSGTRGPEAEKSQQRRCHGNESVATVGARWSGYKTDAQSTGCYPLSPAILPSIRMWSTMAVTRRHRSYHRDDIQRGGTNITDSQL